MATYRIISHIEVKDTMPHYGESRTYFIHWYIIEKKRFLFWCTLPESPEINRPVFKTYDLAEEYLLKKFNTNSYWWQSKNKYKNRSKRRIF